jgi:hypothetical protein
MEGRKDVKKGIKLVTSEKNRYTIRERGCHEVKNKVEKAKRREDKNK